MAIQGFDKTFYLNAKLAQLQSDSATAADWAGKDAAFLEARLNAAGLTAEEHYEQYGYQEDLAPNAFFNPAEYIRAKATDMFNDSNSTYLTIDAAADAFVSLWGGNVYNHYLQYGEEEGINPSNNFDVSAYLEAKLADLQAKEATAAEWAGKSVADVAAAFKDAGITALEHFTAYGQNEGLSAPAVPASEQVEVDTSVPGQTFTLTAGQDNPTATSNDDTFIGVDDGTPAGTSFTLGDVINGGEGNDTLNITTDQASIDAGTATISNVENLVVDSRIGNTFAADLDGVAFENATLEGVTGVDGGADTLTVNGITTATRLKLEEAGQMAITVTYDGVTGASDEATIELAGVTNDVADDDEGSLTAAGIETVNLVFSTADNQLDDIVLADAETVNVTVEDGGAAQVIDDTADSDLAEVDTLNIVANDDFSFLNTVNLADEAAISVSGTGDVNLNTLDTSGGDGNTVNAAELTGALTVTGSVSTASITGGSGNDRITSAANSTAVVAGAGDDYVSVANVDYGVNGAAAVEGGEGTDTVNVTASANLDEDFLSAITGFEVLDVGGSNGTDGGGNGNGNYDVEGLGFEGVTIGTDLTKAATVSGITDEELSITADLTAAATYDLADDTGDNDALTVAIAGAAVDVGNDGDTSNDANDIEASELVFAGIETVTLESNTAETNEAGVDNEVTALATDAEEIVVTGNHALTIGGFENAASDDVNTTIESIDASGSAGLIMGGAVSTTGVSITGSDNADTILVGTVDGLAAGNETGSTINAGQGGDSIDLTAGLALAGTGAVDTIIIDAGDSKIGYVDSNEDGAYATAQDEETFDVVTGFSTGEDTLDLGSFGFSGQKASALADASLTAAEALELVDGTTTEIADFFVDTGVQRGVAIVENIDASNFGGGNNSTLVFIDSDGDGSLNVANDDMIVLSGTQNVALSDFGF